MREEHGPGQQIFSHKWNDFSTISGESINCK